MRKPALNQTLQNCGVLAAERDRGNHAAVAETSCPPGFNNPNVDLMYGLPGLDLPKWEVTLSGMLAWGPEHLSAYAFTLDEGSRSASEGPLTPRLSRRLDKARGVLLRNW